MVSRAPFGSSYCGPENNPALLVDKMIGSSYDVVKYAARNMEYIKHVSYYMEKLYTIEANLDTFKFIENNIQTFDVISANIGILEPIAENILVINSVNNNLDTINELNGNTAVILAASTNVTRIANDFGNVEEAIAAAQQASTVAEQAVITVENIRVDINETLVPEVVDARNAARLWATAPVNASINDGTNPAGHSAYHWAKKAEELALEAGTVPTGGTTGQLLGKLSNNNNDFAWVNPPAGTGGDMTKTAYDPMGIEANVFDSVNQLPYTRADLLTKAIPAEITFLRTTGYAVVGDGGAASYKKVNTQPTHAGKFIDVNGSWYEIADEVLHPEQFASLNDAINTAAALGKVLDGQGKTYTVSSTINLPVTRHTWKNIILDGTGIAVSGDGTTPIVLLDCPLPGPTRNLTANAVLGATSITVTATSSYAVDDWIILRSEKKLAESEANDGRHARACELNQIRSISGTTIELWHPTLDGYNTADTARIEKVQTLGGVDLDNVTFLGCEQGIRVSEGFRSKYNKVSGIGQNAFGVYEDRCYFTTGDKFFFDSKQTTPTFVTGAGYGLAYLGCWNCDYGDVTGSRMRHLTTTGSCGTSKGRTVSGNCSLGDVHCENAFSSIVDQHPGGGYLKVGNVSGTFAANANSAPAVQMQGAGGHVDSINIEGNPNGGAVGFDSYGFFRGGADPTVHVGSVTSRGCAQACSVVNRTNQHGNGQAQRLVMTVGQIKSWDGSAASINTLSADVDFYIGGGRIDTSPNLGNGLGRAISVGQTGSFRARVRLSNVDILSANAAQALRVQGTDLTMLGGSIKGVSSTVVVRAENSSAVRFVGTDEATTPSTVNSTITRASLA